MELRALIDALTDPAAYPRQRPAAVELIQTHISAVFRLDRDVFKLKKPVALGFLDYSTLERRRAFCRAEVELNRPLAPGVYLGVAPIICLDGQVLVGVEPASGDAILDYAVHMRRLPDDRTLEARLAERAAPPELLHQLGRRLAAFHAAAPRAPQRTHFADFDAVADNCLDNFEHIRALPTHAVDPALLSRLRAATDAELRAQEPLIRARAARQIARQIHGDLRLDHVYLFPERPAPDDLLVIDCIEFNDAFRHGDPIVDLAFLVMDLRVHGHREHADALVRGYFEAADDDEGRALLPLYVAYRASVRAKVECIRQNEPEISERSKEQARDRAPRHLLLALSELAAPDQRPALLLVAGLPACGKSTLARGLADAANFVVLRTDVIRKELAGLDAGAPAPAAPGEGIYSDEMTARTYAATLARAAAHLRAGERVLIDANLRGDDQRRPFFELAARLGLPCRLLVCHVPEAVALDRLSSRTGDASDADAVIYRHARAQWREPAPELAAHTLTLDTTPPRERVLDAALTVLRAAALA
jgi:aminoglycoside phosphotransferase family enzyme/predicted kinase